MQTAQPKKEAGQISRYAELITYAAVFLTLVASVFGINLTLANDSRRDAEQIFCATKQQEYWQRLLSNVRETSTNISTYSGIKLSVMGDSTQGAAMKTALDTLPRAVESRFREFATAVQQFDETIEALHKSGEIVVAGAPHFIDEVSESSTRKFVDNIRNRWIVHRDTVMLLVKSDLPKDLIPDERWGRMLDDAVNFAIANDDPILSNNRDFITELGDVATARTNRMQFIQIGALGLSLLVFAAMAVRLTFALRKQDAIIQDSQSQLIQAEKMASLGQMVAGLAHEMNTPLGFIRSNLENIAENEKDVEDTFTVCNTVLSGVKQNGAAPDALIKAATAVENFENDGIIDLNRQLVKGAIEGVDRIQELVVNLKNFSRLDEANLQRSDINDNVDSTLVIAHHILKRHMTINKKLDVNLPKILCYPAQLNQVFLNLMTNASQACEDNPNGGVLLLKTFLDKEFVVVQISDNGKGIPKENLKKIFEPFFTTKPIGQGTGLGLSIVFKIIESHKGKIDVQSEVGKGTDFFIRIPAAKEMGKEQTQNVFQDSAMIN